MARITLVFGAILILLGIAGFVLTGSTHMTALIPCWFGLVLVFCGWLASTEDARRRMLFMHIAVTVGLLGFLFPGVMSVSALIKAHATHAALFRTEAVHEQLAMAIFCLIFVALCVRSFIAARRARVA